MFVATCVPSACVCRDPLPLVQPTSEAEARKASALTCPARRQDSTLQTKILKIGDIFFKHVVVVVIVVANRDIFKLQTDVLGCRQLSGFVCTYHFAVPGSSPKQSALLSFIVKFVLYLSCEKNLKKLRTDVEFVSLQMYQPFLYNFKWVKNILDRLKQCIIYSIVASPFWEKATNWLVDLN